LIIVDSKYVQKFCEKEVAKTGLENNMKTILRKI
jgi:hypothetical protein